MVPFRAVGHVMSSLFYPLLTFALLAVVIAYWAITAVYPSMLCAVYSNSAALRFQRCPTFTGVLLDRFCCPASCPHLTSRCTKYSTTASVHTHLTPATPRCAFKSILEILYWLPHRSCLRQSLLLSLSADVQHVQCFRRVPWCRVLVCLLRRGDPLPQIPHPLPVLQRFPLLLVCQLRDSLGPGHPGGGLRLLLLGFQKAWRYSRQPHLCLVGPGPSVSGWWWGSPSVGLGESVQRSHLLSASSPGPDTTQALWLLAL